jgi:Transcriptional regulator, AbiEi antitoxin, Type IV TA system
VNIAKNVNTVESSEIERRLADALRQLLSDVGWLKGWTVKPESSKRDRSRWDLIASGPLSGGGKAMFCIECKHHFQPSQFLTLADRPCPADRRETTSRVLAMPYVSPRMASLCQQHGWSWFDLAGNCRLDLPGALLVERSGQEPVRLDQPSAANLSSPEAGRVIRALLAPENAGKRWTQREIVGHFNTLSPPVDPPSLALVNKVVQHLRDQAFLEPLPNRGFRVRDQEGLLRVWRQAYRFDRAQRRRYFSLLQGRALADSLRALDAIADGRLAYAAFSAADIQAPHVRQARTWLYLAGDLEEQFKLKIEAKLVDSGENLIVLIPDDSGVFYRPDISKNRLACTNAVQTYIDLAHAGGRGEEAAEAVLLQRLKPAWSRGDE